MDQDAIDQAKNDLANALLMMTDQLTPVFDAADGIRADMLRRGWSETATEQAALQWLMNSMQVCFNGWAQGVGGNG